MFGRVIVLITLTASLAQLCGCRGLVRGIKDAFSDKDDYGEEIIAKYWDGPRIGPGMNLVIQVGSVSTPTVSMTVLVDQNGEVTLQHLLEKPIKCDGMTLDEFKAKLVAEYSVYYRQPLITVAFGNSSGYGVSPWGTVIVMGEVGNPGPVNMPPTMDLTITKVLQLAGGLKPFADNSCIRLTRCDKDGYQSRYEIDLNEIGEEGRFDKDMTLRAGDVVFVPESWY